MFATFVLQASLLVAPLTTGDAPPETRALAAVRFGTSEGNGFRYDVATPERWRAKAKAGEEFLAFARSCAANPTAAGTGLVGTYWRPMLAQDTGDFLFSAAIGDVNEYEPARDAEHRPLVALRIERDAACRQIFVSGTDAGARAKADAIVRELRAGADFATLARERSDDRASALRGGDFAIFERGPHDALLREAAFNIKPGEISSVIASPIGFHILQRVEVSALDPRLRDDLWARARGILVAFGGAKGADPALVREHDEAERIANDLAARIRRGDDMAALAKEFNDDGRGEHGGRARAGDLGWVRRATTAMPQFMDRLFTEMPGTLIGPIASEAGFVLLRRDDPGLRSRIDLRKSAFVDFERWIRQGSSDDGDQWTVAATHAAQLIGDAFDWPFGNDSLDAILARCSSASDFAVCCERLPEIARGSKGKELTLRMLAREYAAELAKIEPKFRAEVWSRDEHAIDAALIPLREQLVTLGDCALDETMKDFDMCDPRVIVPIYFVTEADEPFRLVESDGRFTALIIDVGRLEVQDRLQMVLHWATAVLDIATHDQSTVLADVRERLKAPERCQPIEVHALISAESAEVVTRVFGPGLTAKLYYTGWINSSEHCDGRHASDAEVTPDRGRRVSAAIDTWKSHLAGKKTRAEALDAIVAAAQAAK